MIEACSYISMAKKVKCYLSSEKFSKTQFFLFQGWIFNFFFLSFFWGERRVSWTLVRLFSEDLNISQAFRARINPLNYLKTPVKHIPRRSLTSLVSILSFPGDITLFLVFLIRKTLYSNRPCIYKLTTLFSLPHN